MAIYTGVADANGDFNIPFSANYTGGQKVTVTAEKDAATKSIEIFAPSEVVGGGPIQFSGTMDSFPAQIGVVTVDVSPSTTIPAGSFDRGSTGGIFNYATGLIIKNGVTVLGASAFIGWGNAVSLTLPNTITYIGESCFSSWSKLQQVTVPASIEEILFNAFANASSLIEFKCLSETPPQLGSSVFSGANSNLIIKVPAASVAAYQAASNWSSYAAKIQAI